jgi:hypothetical protein
MPPASREFQSTPGINAGRICAGGAVSAYYNVGRLGGLGLFKFSQCIFAHQPLR